MGNISKYGWACALNLLAAAACSGVESADELNRRMPPATGGSAGAAAGETGSGATGGATAGTTGTGGTGGAIGGSGGVPGAGAASGSGGSAAAPAGGTAGAGGGSGGGAAVGGDTTAGGASGVGATGGTAGDTATGGMAGTGGDTATGGMAGTSGAGGIGPYSARSGPFNMLVYSRTEGHPHDSIPAGQQMLRSIAEDYGFEVTETTENNEITLEGLSRYEIVFFMNPTGNIFDPPHEAAFQEWMTTRNGAFAGCHSATDTERDWPFYKEVTGQYYDSHDNVSAGTIQWESDAISFVGVAELPSPWQRDEEWYRFRSWEQWSTKEGFKILSKVTTNTGGTRPVSYIREYNNFRSFYSSLGHQGPTFEDPAVKQHFAAGIMWAVRREAMVQ